MFATFDEARRYVEEHEVQMVDLKFTDLWGRWHHLTISQSQFTPALLRMASASMAPPSA
jgi:glutamine synthetase